MSARPSKKSARHGKKEEEETPVEEPPQKSAEELLEEQLTATLLHIPSTPAPRPLHSPDDVLWSVSLEEVLVFCFPPGVQHPLSRGRLCVLAEQGPLVRRHSYTACLCAECQRLVRERRKESEHCRRVFLGELFTRANIPPRARKAAEASASPRAAAAASSVSFAPSRPLTALPNPPPSTVPALSLQSHSPGANLGDTAPFTVHSVADFSPGSTMRSTSQFADTATAALTSPSPLSALHSTLHNSSTQPFELHPSYHAHSVDQLDFLCARCRAHARSQAHLMGSRQGQHVLTELQLTLLARRCEDEDLLRAYDRWGKLEAEEEREFLSSLSRDKLARARANYTPQQIEGILARVPRLRDAAGQPTDRMDFYAMAQTVRDERARRVGRLAQMYPDVALKGDKSAQNTAVQLVAPTKRGNLGSSARGAQRGGEEEEEKEHASVNGVRWQGESVLTTGMLARKSGIPPHQSSVLRARLLHKHTHQVVQLGPGVDHPAVQLSVALMRNTALSDKTEGWKQHF